MSIELLKQNILILNKMDKQKIKNRINKLKQEINYYRYLYHVFDKTEISDGALDSLKNELYKLEIEHPEFITSDSPTQRVGGKPLEKFVKIKHSKPMISLFDAFSKQDMIDWEKRGLKIIKNNISLDYYCELKLDGLAMSLLYKKGLFKQGATRGDGKIGEDVSQNLRTIESIPLRLRIPKEDELKKIGFNNDEITIIINSIKNRNFEVRGEVIMLKKVFQELNKKYKKQNKPLLSNPRNGAAGSIRQLDPKLSAERKLDFYVYEIISDFKFRKHEQKAKLAKLLGFKVLKYNKFCKDINAVEKFHNYWEEHKNKLPMEIDGIVVKVNDLKLWDILGVVGKGPRYMIAYKFTAEQAVSKVKKVVWQIGRTGTLTPVAVLDPVKVGGVTITHATLHNIDEIKRLNLKINDTVIVERAGDVIPKIVKVLLKLRDGCEKKIEYPKQCPVCGNKVERKLGEVAYRCLNKNCYAINLRKLSHWTSKGAMDIEGLGPKVVEQLIKSGLVNDISDFYSLTIDDLKPLERFADKSAENLIKAIKNKKEIDLERFIYGLGIRHIGEETAVFLSKKIKLKTNKISELINTFQKYTKEELENFEDIGPVMVDSLFNWFRDEKNLEILKKLEQKGVVIKKIEQKKQTLNGKIFVITGTLLNLTRADAKSKIRELGGSISSTISKKIDFVVVGKNPGSKYNKAVKLGVKIISEDEFKKIL